MSDNDDIWGTLRQHWEECAAKERPLRQRASHPNMEAIAEMTFDMENSGWRRASYCPKDGSLFWAWEPTCSTPFLCAYRGEWPNGKYDAHCDGDIWSATPILFRAITDSEREAMRAKK